MGGAASCIDPFDSPEITEEEARAKEAAKRRREEAYDPAHHKMLEQLRAADELAAEGKYEQAIAAITAAEALTTQLATHHVKEAHLHAIAISQRRGTYRRLLHQLTEAIEEYEFGLAIGEQRIERGGEAAGQYLLLHLMCECSTLTASCHMALVVGAKKVLAIREARKLKSADAAAAAFDLMNAAPDDIGAFSMAGPQITRATPTPAQSRSASRTGGHSQHHQHHHNDSGRNSRALERTGSNSQNKNNNKGSSSNMMLSVPGGAGHHIHHVKAGKGSKGGVVTFAPGSDDEILGAGANSFSFAASFAQSALLLAGDDGDTLADELERQAQKDPVLAPMIGQPDAALETLQEYNAKSAEQVLLKCIGNVEDLQNRQSELLLSPLFRLADLYETLGMTDHCMRAVRRLVGIALVKYGHDHEIYLRQCHRLSQLAVERESRKTLKAVTMIAKTWKMKAQMKRLRAANARVAYAPRRHTRGERTTAPPDDKSAVAALEQVQAMAEDPPSDRDEEEEEEDDDEFDEYDGIDLEGVSLELAGGKKPAAAAAAPIPAGTFGALKAQAAALQQ